MHQDRLVFTLSEFQVSKRKVRGSREVPLFPFELQKLTPPRMDAVIYFIGFLLISLSTVANWLKLVLL